MPWQVYLVKNKQNGKGYVGITSRSLVDRLADHFNDAFPGKRRNGGRLIPFHAAIQKYGYEGFTIETLEDDLTLGEAQDQETHWIKKLFTHATAHRTGYNVSWGGEDPDWDPDEYEPVEFVRDFPEKEYRSPGDDCPSCGGELGLRDGPYGDFLACDGYPNCQYTCSVD